MIRLFAFGAMIVMRNTSNATKDLNLKDKHSRYIDRRPSRRSLTMRTTFVQLTMQRISADFSQLQMTERFSCGTYMQRNSSKSTRIMTRQAVSLE